MSAADPEGSPSDTGGGSSSTPRGAASEAEVIEVDEGKAVPVISPALVYDTKGEVWALPVDIVKAVDALFAERLQERTASGRSWTPRESTSSC